MAAVLLDSCCTTEVGLGLATDSIQLCVFAGDFPN